jgi:hypothetical protein
MYRIDNATSVSSIPTPEAVGPNPDHFFTKGNPSLGVPATIVTADWANAVQEEIVSVLTAAGLTPSKTTRTQLRDAINLLISNNGSAYAASTTAANTYTATMAPAPTAYAAGQLIFIKFSNHNTGAATINLNALGAKSIKRQDGSALSAYDIVDSMMAVLIYDGTNFILCNAFDVYDRQNDAANYAASTTAANTYTATLSPAPLAYTTGMRISIKFTNHNTGAATINLNSLGAKAIVLGDQSALVNSEIADGMIADLRYDGTSFILLNPATIITKSVLQTGSATYAASTTAANTYTATLTPTLTAYTTGMRVFLKFTNKNTGAATINIDSLGAKSIKMLDGSALVGNEIQDGMIAELSYDGTNFQLLNKFDLVATKAQQETGTLATSFVAPSVQHQHKSAIKAWLIANHSAGTPTIAGSYGVTSLTDSGVGLVTINLSVTFVDANWSPMWTGGQGTNYCYASNTSRNSTSCQAIFINASNSQEDMSTTFFTFHAAGTLA